MKKCSMILIVMMKPSSSIPRIIARLKYYIYDINGFVLYQKWFDDGKFLKPRFLEAARCHKISRETLILLLSTSVQTEIIL